MLELSREMTSYGAPSCFGVAEQGDTGFIWLEDVPDAASAPWPLDRYYWVERKLGVLNGHYLVGNPLPAGDFSSRRWTEGSVASWDPLRTAIP